MIHAYNFVQYGKKCNEETDDRDVDCNHDINDNVGGCDGDKSEFSVEWLNWTK